MEKDTLKKNLFQCIKEEVKTTDILKQYKDEGGTQLGAYKILSEILDEIRNKGLEEKYENRTMDIMDLVSGIVSPSYRIWDNILSNKEIEEG